MSHYSEQYEAEEEARLMRTYGPEHLPALTEGNLRYNIARANAAEAELSQIKAALQTLRRFNR